MSSTTVRISTETQQILKRMAEQEGEAMQVVLDRALELYRRRRFLERTNAAYAMERNVDGWTPERELRAWEVTLGDGVPKSPRRRRHR